MTIDSSYNVYLTINGKNAFDIYSPSGRFLKSIKVPEKPINVCFGGKCRNELYITTQTSLYRIALDTQVVY